MAYTYQPTSIFDFRSVLKILLPQKVSFIWLRDFEDQDTFSNMLDVTYQGNVIQSPTIASFLEDVIAFGPDPLDSKHWVVLYHLFQKLTEKEIANKLSVSLSTIKNRVQEIKEILLPIILHSIISANPGGNSGVDDTQELSLNDLKNWYWQNHVKYGR